MKEPKATIKSLREYLEEERAKWEPVETVENVAAFNQAMLTPLTWHVSRFNRSAKATVHFKYLPELEISKIERIEIEGQHVLDYPITRLNFQVDPSFWNGE